MAQLPTPRVKSDDPELSKRAQSERVRTLNAITGILAGDKESASNALKSAQISAMPRDDRKSMLSDAGEYTMQNVTVLLNIRKDSKIVSLVYIVLLTKLLIMSSTDHDVLRGIRCDIFLAVSHHLNINKYSIRKSKIVSLYFQVSRILPTSMLT